MKTLYREDGEQAGMWDIVEWWTDRYPQDIFPGLTPATKTIADIRDKMLTLKKIRENTQKQKQQKKSK